MTDRYASLKQGLVGCWIPSVSGSGLLLPDLSGRNNHGSLVDMDASDWVSSQYGRALDFDGVNDYVSTTRASGISSQSSVCAWVYPRDIATYQIVISEDPTTSALSRNFVFGYGLTSGKLIAVDFRGGLFDIYESAASLIANTWQHISWTRKTTGMVFHVNGVQSGSTFSYTSALNTNSVATRIGVRELGDGFTNALLDDIRVYNRALTEPEIRLLSSEPGIGFKPAKKLSRFSQRFTYKPAKPRNYGVIRNRDPNYSTLRHGLVAAYCPSISGQGNVLPDLVGGNHGTLTNMDASDWVSSGDGRALDFDYVAGATRQAVELSNNVSVRGLATASISLWCNLQAAPANNAGLFYESTASNGFTKFGIFQTPANALLFVARDTSSGSSFSITHTPAASQWLHVVGNYNSNSDLMELFVNGSSVGTNTSAKGVFINEAPATTITIGAYTDSTTAFNYSCNALVDDVRLYSRILSESEIRLLASRPGIGLRQESHRQTFYQFPSFQPAIARRSSAIIGGGIT